MRIFVTKPQLKPEVTGYGSADKNMLFRGLCWTFLQILGHSAYDPKMPDHFGHKTAAETGNDRMRNSGQRYVV